MQIGKLFEQSPSLEIVVKNLYWRSPHLVDWIQKRKKRSRKPETTAAAPPAKVDFEKIAGRIAEFGVGTGDILIVHSAMSSLKGTGLSPRDINLRLKRIVGDTGTLAMPSIPMIRGEPSGVDMLSEEKYAGVFEYDVKKSPCSTGALPKDLQNIPSALRSRHPLNTLTALGPHAPEMMKANLEGPAPTPCGPGSSWEYCYRHGAKIVAIGVDLAHSLTMIHLAEDLFEDAWPFKNWYRERTYKVIDGDFKTEVTIRQRRHAWSVFYAERSFSRDLFRYGVAKREVVDGVELSFIDSRALIDFLNARKSKGYPYKVPFRKLVSKLI